MEAEFRTNDINKARLIWDPSVHQHYQEECRYLLMRFHDPEVSNIVPQLEEMMEKALIQSYNIYLVYGYYDVFLRVFATPQKWARAKELFRRFLSHRLANQEEFHIDRMDYVWAPRLSNRTPRVDAYRNQIEQVSMKEADNDLSIDDADLTDLLKAGLVHRLEEEPEGSIKFYVLLSRFGYRFPSPTEYDEIRRTLVEGSLPYVRKPSIYSVTGGSAYFLKFVVEKYDEILPVISVLTLNARNYGLRTMTLLISNANAPESDVIDPHWDEFPGPLFQLEGLLRPSASTIGISLARLDSQTRFTISRTFERHRSLMEERLFLPMFEGFFLARAEENIQVLSEKLNWITHLEALFRTFLQEIARSQLGGQWFDTVQAAAKQVGVKEEKLEQYSLRDTVSVLSKLVHDGKLSSVVVEGRLGSDWESRIRGLTEPFGEGLEIRNHLAHGRLYDRAAQYWEHWTDVAERIFDAADIYIRLRKDQSGRREEDVEVDI
jgi:hypothetical protein